MKSPNTQQKNNTLPVSAVPESADASNVVKKQKKRDHKMTEDEKEINRKILKNMNKKLNFVKNPRFRNQPKCLLYTNSLFKDMLSPENPFVVEPKIVIFREYILNCVYQLDLKLLNRTQLLTSFKYVPPLTENFTIKRVIYPKKDSALVAPGMCARMEILFNATSLDSFEDELTIITEPLAFKVALKAIRDTPALSLGNPMDCQKCLIGDQVSMVFRCKNNGGDAHFKFLTSESSYEMSSNNEVLNIGPFSIFPQEFYLYKGMPIEIFVNFSPKNEGILEKEIILCCDSKTNIPYKIQGEGIKIDLKLMSLDGLGLDEADEKLENLFFNDTYPFTITQRVLKVKNISTVTVKYHWSIYEFIHHEVFSMDQEDSHFTIEPEEGTFQPLEEITFVIKFNPKNSKIYEQKLDLIVEDVPFQAIKNFSSPSTIIRNNFTRSEPFIMALNSPYPSYPLYSFNLRGRGRLASIECDRNYIDLGKVYMGQKVVDNFKISNPKAGLVKFRIKKIMQILTKPRVHVSNFFKNNNLSEDSIFKEKKSIATKETQYTLLDLGHDLKNLKELQFNEHNTTTVTYLQISTGSKNVVIVAKTGGTTRRDTQRKDSIARRFNRDRTTRSITLGYKRATSILPNIPIDSQQQGADHDVFVNTDTLMQIEKDKQINFQINFCPVLTGLYKSSIVFQPEEGISFSIDIKANVIGPKIRVDIPSIDFGLFSVSEIRTVKFKIINTSPISARYLIKESRYNAVNFSNYEDKDNEYINEIEGIIKESISRKRIETLVEFDNRDLIKDDLSKMDSYQLKFSSVTGIIFAGSSVEICATFMSPYPKHLSETIEFMVEDSESVYLNLSARCEQSFAYIEPTVIHPKEILLSMPMIHEDNTLKIVNPSNLPVNFKWEDIFVADRVSATFTPNQGSIAPHSYQEIKFSVVYYSIETVDDLFKCNIEEMDVPLGFIIQGKVTGLNIGYEITDETLAQLQICKTSVSEVRSMSSMSPSLSPTYRKRNTLFLVKEEKPDKTLRSIDLKNLRVNKPYYFSFVIKNLSGIPTSIKLNCVNYPPGQEKTLAKDMAMYSQTISEKSKTSSKGMPKSFYGKTKKSVLDHLLLTNVHEEINFTSPKGSEFTKMKQIEKESVLYLSNQKGIAIIIDPKQGKLDPHSESLVTLSFFNECVGEFHDELVCSVKGLPPVVIPISLKIRGNPLQLSPFQAGIDYLADPPLLKMGHVLRNVNIIEKNVKLINTGSNLLSINWKIYDYEDVIHPKRDVFTIRIRQNNTMDFSLMFNPVKPHEFKDDKKFFTVSPENVIVQPKSAQDFTVSFSTDEAGLKSALLVGYPKIEGESHVHFSELALKVDANGVKPNLVVDKRPTLDNKIQYKFIAHSFGTSPKSKRSIVLINKEKITMMIKLILQGPFKIIKTDPMEATIGNMIYNIIPNSNLKLDIKFLPPEPSNEKDWPMTLINEQEGLLTVIYQNNESSSYHLRAILKRPRLRLSTTGNDSIETDYSIYFGYVNCDSFKKSPLFLMNETEVETKWTINYIRFVHKQVYGYGTITQEEKEDMEMADDPEVFHFDCSKGIIQGPSHALINLPIGPGMPKVPVEVNAIYNPVKIQIMFKPKKNIFYKCRYRIVAETGNCIDFILKGNGSYLEEHLV